MLVRIALLASSTTAALAALLLAGSLPPVAHPDKIEERAPAAATATPDAPQVNSSALSEALTQQSPAFRLFPNEEMDAAKPAALPEDRLPGGDHDWPTLIIAVVAGAVAGAIVWKRHHRPT